MYEIHLKYIIDMKECHQSEGVIHLSPTPFTLKQIISLAKSDTRKISREYGILLEELRNNTECVVYWGGEYGV